MQLSNNIQNRIADSGLLFQTTNSKENKNIKRDLFMMPESEQKNTTKLIAAPEVTNNYAESNESELPAEGWVQSDDQDNFNNFTEEY